jgi:XRE family transcriptional regulator, regulator of sulfur utilization
MAPSPRKRLRSTSVAHAGQPGAKRPPPVGSVVRRLRGEKSLTLAALARAAGVSKSMLSELERGISNPTVAVAWRLASALDIGLERLLTWEDPALSGISVIGLHETPSLTDRAASYVLRVLNPVDLGGHFEWYELILRPGAALVSAAHEPGTMEHLTVLSGSVEVSIGDTKRTLNSGATARYSADQKHAIKNRGKRSASAFLVVVHR